MYLRGTIDPISADEEKALILRWQQHQDYEARDRMAAANLRFVHDVAQKFSVPKGMEFEDLLQAGSEGLLEAIDRFDVTRGFKFISYAVWWIRQGIHHYIERAALIRLPTNQRAVSWDFLRNEKEMLHETGQLPHMSDIMERMQGTEKYKDTNLDEMVAVYAASRPVISLSAAAFHSSGDKDSMSIEDLLGSQEPEAFRDHTMLDHLMSHLSGRSRIVVELYYGIGQPKTMTLEEIGAIYGFTRERARQIKDEALALLKVLCKHRRMVLEDLLP